MDPVTPGASTNGGGAKPSGSKGINPAIIAGIIGLAALIVAGVLLAPRIIHPSEDVASDGPAVEDTQPADEPAEDEAPATQGPIPASIMVTDVDASDYPTVVVTLAITDESGSAVTDLSSSDMSVVDIDGSSRVSPSAVGLAQDGSSYRLTYVSALDASSGSRVTAEATLASDAYEGSTTISYEVPKEEEPAPATTAPATPQAPSQPAQPTSQPSTTSHSGYILPYSDSRYYSYDELYALSADELELARNEIYARHGRGFNTDYIQAYFNSCSWYTRLYSPEEFDAMLANNPSIFNDYEYVNVSRCDEVEDDKRGY